MSSAIKEIPAFGISIAIANVEQGRLSTLNDVELAFISSFANGNFFEGYDWYTPTTSNPRLNSVEQANSKFVRSHMDKR